MPRDAGSRRRWQPRDATSPRQGSSGSPCPCGPKPQVPPRSSCASPPHGLTAASKPPTTGCSSPSADRALGRGSAPTTEPSSAPRRLPPPPPPRRARPPRRRHTVRSRTTAHATRRRPGQPGARAGQAELTTVCISGGWSYVDEKGVTRQATELPVSGCSTSTARAATTCWPTASPTASAPSTSATTTADTDEGGLVDPAVNFVTSNSRWRVREHADVEPRLRVHEALLRWTRPANIGLGNLKPGDSSGMRAVQALRRDEPVLALAPVVVLGRQRRRRRLPADRHQLDPHVHRRHVLLATLQRRPPRGGRPRLRHTRHPRGRPRGDGRRLRGRLPDRPNCNPHRIEKFSSPGCAWTEGFAEWVPASVLKDPYYRFAERHLHPARDAHVGDAGLGRRPRRRGPRRRGDDRPRGHPERVRSGTGRRGRPTPTAVDDVPQRRGDTDLLRPLRVRPAPPWASASTTGPGRRCTRTRSTSASTTRSPTAPSCSARLRCRTPSMSTPPAPSLVGRGRAGAVRVELRPRPVRQPQRGRLPGRQPCAVRRPRLRDGRLAPAAARGLLPEGDGHRRYRLYQIEYAQSGTSLFDGTQTVTMGVDDVIHVRDTLMEANVPTYFRAVPARRSERRAAAPRAARRHDLAGPGLGSGPSRRARTPGSAAPNRWSTPRRPSSSPAWCCSTRRARGRCTVYRDTTAPTGSVVINGGAASTTSRT